MKFQEEKRVSHVHDSERQYDRIVSSRRIVAFVHTYYVLQHDDGLGIMYSTLLSAIRRVNAFTELQ